MVKKIKTENHNFIPIVGEYGSGKSLLSMYILYTLCNEKNLNVIPIFISLGDIDYKNDLKTDIFDYVKKEYKIFDEKFLEYTDKGKLIFILDAFDELTQNIDEKIIVKI